jgi:GNAT superfamily N-acetyltransferase
LDKGQVVACAGANLENDHPVSANLSFCVVHRDYRGRGLQARLLEARVKWARAEHCSEAKTYSHKSNTPSLLNLLKAGFEVCVYEDPYVSVRKEL